jgi:hypothetical protein
MNEKAPRPIGQEVTMKSFLTLTLVGALAVAAPAYAQDASIYLELMGDPTRDEIPENGAAWHELWPEFCAVLIQEDYGDNGDGVISACDYIMFQRTTYHVEWAGPTYYIESDCSGEAGWLEPTEPPSGGSPVCEVWHWVYPDFCRESHVEHWIDQGDGIFGVGDSVEIDGTWYEVIAVGVNITATPSSPVEQGTWSSIKHFFRELF